MSVSVKIGRRLSEYTGGEKSFDVEGATLGEVIGAVDAAHPGFRDQVFKFDGVLDWVLVSGGGRDHGPFRFASDRVSDETVIRITLAGATAGG